MAPPPSATQASEGLDAAYAVVERYLEEGRRYVDGQGRWNGAAATSLPLDGLLGLLQRLLSQRLPIPATDELVRLATWLTQQLASAAQPPTVSRDEPSTSTAPTPRPPWAMPYNPNPPGGVAKVPGVGPPVPFDFTPASESDDSAVGSESGSAAEQGLGSIDSGLRREKGSGSSSLPEWKRPEPYITSGGAVAPNITRDRKVIFDAVAGTKNALRPEGFGADGGMGGSIRSAERGALSRLTSGPK